MEVEPNGSNAYYEFLTQKAEHDQVERGEEREHLERMKRMELGLSHEQRDKRRDEMAHQEKMKSLELGLVPNLSRMPLALVCAAIGAGLPIGVSVVLMKASLLQSNFDQANWMIVPILGLPAIILAGILAWRGLISNGPPARLPVTESLKEELDPDAYDVVGRRG